MQTLDNRDCPLLHVLAGGIPKGALYVGTNERIEGGFRHTDQFYLVPVGHETGEDNPDQNHKPVTSNSAGKPSSVQSTTHTQNNTVPTQNNTSSESHSQNNTLKTKVLV